MNTIYFSSDHHLGHKNIIKYSNRPFCDIHEHDSEIIARHNKIVKPNDIVYFLGDFSLGQPKHFINYLWRFNGQINYIFGNHDKSAREIVRRRELRDQYKDLDDKIKFLGDYSKIRFNNQKIILTHYAFRVWDGSHRGTWNLYGHSHGSLPDNPNAMQIDVGVDCFNYNPIDFYQIQEIMNKKNFKPIDHHRESKYK